MAIGTFNCNNLKDLIKGADVVSSETNPVFKCVQDFQTDPMQTIESDSCNEVGMLDDKATMCLAKTLPASVKIHWQSKSLAAAPSARLLHTPRFYFLIFRKVKLLLKAGPSWV